MKTEYDFSNGVRGKFFRKTPNSTCRFTSMRTYKPTFTKKPSHKALKSTNSSMICLKKIFSLPKLTANTERRHNP